MSETRLENWNPSICGKLQELMSHYSSLNLTNNYFKSKGSANEHRHKFISTDLEINMFGQEEEQP